jgi:hypothetical protein
MVIGAAVLAACSPQMPDSAAGVGFDSFEAIRAREEALTASPLPPPTAVSQETLGPAPLTSPAASIPTATSVQALNPADPAQPRDAILDAAASLDAVEANSGQEPLQASPSNPAPAQLNNPGISDENDFSAVADRETIQSDAERIAENRAQYQVIQPTALPSRAAAGGQPNIVQYALATRHARGTKIYSRAGINMAARAQRNCAGYPSADQAQIDFLERGGPERDRMGLDPDGDGFACDWDPTPFRSAVRN